MQRTWLTALVASVLIGSLAHAADAPAAGTPPAPAPPAGAAPAMPAPPPAAVFCGSVTCFRFRTYAQGRDPSNRADFAMEVINKYLGGAVGKVTTKPAGKNIQLRLNNEFIAVVTPEDAAAEKQKTVAALAARWTKLLSDAFNVSKARP